VVVEAASHEAVHAYGARLLSSSVTLIVLSGGALADDVLRMTLERTAAQHGTLLYVPSGGIGGLDALKAACIAGVEEVTIAVTKPAIAWKGIAYVERLGVDLDRLTGPVVLFDGPARAGVPHFPANVNIAAVLSLAGVGLDRTRLKVVADPFLTHNTHFIEVRGKTGNISIKLENVPSADNPKTALLACYPVQYALRNLTKSKQWSSLRPRPDALERARCLQYSQVAEAARDDLQTHRQSRRREATRTSRGRQPRHIERIAEASPAQPIPGMLLPVRRDQKIGVERSYRQAGR